jgi:hypothetical protein
MQFDAYPDAPNDGASYGWCQVITDDCKFVAKGSNNVTVFAENHAKTIDLPPFDPNDPNSFWYNTGAGGSYSEVDSPDVPLHQASAGTYSRCFSATMWYMYQPSGGIAVPLASYNWDLVFSVVYTPGPKAAWEYTVKVVEPYPSSGMFTPTTEFPEWVDAVYATERQENPPVPA